MTITQQEVDEEFKEIIAHNVTLAPEGLAFGDGTISVRARLLAEQLHEHDVTIGREIIHEDPDVFRPVDPDAHDDGCGDGRSVIAIYRYDTDGNRQDYAKSRCRAKLFGGGLAASASMYRAVAGPAVHGETVLGDREFMAGQLEVLGIEHGAHTDAHAEGENCGCGAIDKYQPITENIVVFEEQIVATLRALYGDAFEDNASAIEQVLANYRALAKNGQYFANGSGKQTMSLLEKKGAIIKQLGGEHREGLVVLNDVEGTTLDQPMFDKKLRERGVEAELQVFIVDTWRGRMYAAAVAKVAQETGVSDNPQQAERLAYADFLIRTLAVAATLTGGDLPVEGRLPEGQANFAPSF